MKEQLINQILFCMQDMLHNDQMAILKNTLQSVLFSYKIESKQQEIMVLNDCWREDLNDYLMAKALEGKSPTTIQRYRYELTRLLGYLNKSLKKIRSDDISEYMRVYKKLRNVSNQTLKNVRACYSSFFVWIHSRGRINKNPMAMVEQIKVEKKLKKAFSDTERELLSRNCKNVRDKAIIEFLYSTAVRVSELSQLNITDIRFGSKDMIVYGKGNKERMVYLNEKAHMYLKEYLETRTDNNPALFVSEKAPHQRLTKNGIEDIVRRIGKAVNVKAYPHRFRRTAATNALNRGMPVQEVAKLLGHAKLETTMEYCTVEQESVQFHHKKYLSA